MQYKNIDKLPVNTPVIEFYRNKHLLTDFYNGCNLQGLMFNGSKIILTLEVIHEAGHQDIHTKFSITLSDVQILEMELEGKSLDDLGQLSEVVVLNEKEGKLQLTIASSIWLILQCSTLSVNGI